MCITSKSTALDRISCSSFVSFNAGEIKVVLRDVNINTATLGVPASGRLMKVVPSIEVRQKLALFNVLEKHHLVLKKSKRWEHYYWFTIGRHLLF